MIKAILIDDESNARETLRHQIQKYLPQIEVAGEADSVDTGIALIEQSEPDLVFLDIEMPIGSGFDILDATRHLRFQVIFVTAFSQYALQAFKFAATAYLMKPIRISELKEAVERVMERDPRIPPAQQLQVLSHNLGTQGATRSKIVLPDLTGFIVVEVPNIIRCEGERNYTVIHLTDQPQVLVTRTLKEFDDLLNQSGFLRIHQSHLVNLAHVKRYIRGKGGEVEMIDKVVLPVSRHKKAELLKWFQIGG